MRDERKLLDGEFSVYPGHPITVAYLITHEYASFEAAAAPTEHNFCDAVGNNNIPGAGGNVYAAMDLLAAVVKQGKTVQEAFDQADATWARCDDQQRARPERWSTGQAQADRVKERLRERLQAWL